MKIELKNVGTDKVVRVWSVANCYTVLHQFEKNTLLQDCVTKDVFLMPSGVMCVVQEIENSYFFWVDDLLNSWDL